MSKESTCNAGATGSIPRLGRSSGEGHGNLLQYSCGKSHGQRSLAGYSPYGHKELDMTEQLSLHFICHWASLVAQTGKNLPAMPETWVQSLGWKELDTTEHAHMHGKQAWIPTPALPAPSRTLNLSSSFIK